MVYLEKIKDFEYICEVTVCVFAEHPEAHHCVGIIELKLREQQLCV